MGGNKNDGCRMEDSGKRQQFDTGAVRDTAEGKSRPDLISPYAQWRKGEWLYIGAEKYAERNWEKGIPFGRCIASIFRHLLEYMMGLTNEDHLAAIAVNAEFIMHFEKMIEMGVLPSGLDDRPKYEQQQCKLINSPKTTAVYLSHYIRGPKGLDATPQDIIDCSNDALRFVDQLRRTFPELDVYVPAEHDEFVDLAYKDGFLTEEQLLDIDCTILGKRDCVIAYAPDNYKLSRGMQKEVDYAFIAGIPRIILKEFGEVSIRNFIDLVVLEKKQ